MSGGQIGPSTDAGEIFIFTDSNFSRPDAAGIAADLPVSSFPQARAGLSAGLNPTVHPARSEIKTVPRCLPNSHPSLPC